MKSQFALGIIFLILVIIIGLANMTGQTQFPQTLKVIQFIFAIIGGGLLGLAFDKWKSK